jgi:hypothetical protein
LDRGSGVGDCSGHDTAHRGRELEDMRDG